MSRVHLRAENQQIACDQWSGAGERIGDTGVISDALRPYSPPPQSGKYTFSRSTAGVAETSPPVWKTHFTARRETFSGEMVCSAALTRVLSRFWPAEGHSARFFSCSA